MFDNEDVARRVVRDLGRYRTSEASSHCAEIPRADDDQISALRLGDRQNGIGRIAAPIVRDHRNADTQLHGRSVERVLAVQVGTENISVLRRQVGADALHLMECVDLRRGDDVNFGEAAERCEPTRIAHGVERSLRAVGFNNDSLAHGEVSFCLAIDTHACRWDCSILRESRNGRQGSKVRVPATYAAEMTHTARGRR